MNDKCILIEGNFIGCADSCFSDYIIFCFKICNNSFYNLENLKMIICLNDYIEVKNVSSNINKNIHKNKIVTCIDKMKAHEIINYEMNLKSLTFNGISFKIVILNQCGLILSSEKFSC